MRENNFTLKIAINVSVIVSKELTFQQQERIALDSVLVVNSYQVPLIFACKAVQQMNTSRIKEIDALVNVLQNNLYELILKNA